MPTISIITISFNNLTDLQKTCASVDTQRLRPSEYIIIDGSTKPEIKNYLENNTQPQYLKWICEPDNGIADAFNKGIRKATGDIIYLLNSGDALHDDTILEKVTVAFEKNPAAMWCHGKLHLRRGGIWVDIGKPFEKNKLYRGMRGTLHPTMYIRRELYDIYGLFDTSLKMAMDYDFLCRIANEPFIFINDPLATFDPTGVSTSNYLTAMSESHTQYRKYFGPSLKQTLWGWRLKFMHHLLESSFGKFLYRIKVKMGKENT